VSIKKVKINDTDIASVACLFVASDELRKIRRVMSLLLNVNWYKTKPWERRSSFEKLRQRLLEHIRHTRTQHAWTMWSRWLYLCPIFTWQLSQPAKKWAHEDGPSIITQHEISTTNNQTLRTRWESHISECWRSCSLVCDRALLRPFLEYQDSHA
jgi:hypothetical protein